MKLITLTAGYVILMTCAATGLADTHYVATNGAHQTPFTNGWGSAATNIQSAINAAVAADTVLVSNGTYSLSAVITVDGAITVRGFSGNRDDVIITANGAAIRGFNLKNNALLADLTVTNFNAGAVATLDGAGVLLNNGGATISNCVIVSCTGRYGGGLNSDSEVYGQTGIVLNCRIEGNSATASGGGLCNPALVRDCTIRRNTAQRGAGIELNGTLNINIFNSTISENSANTDFGGGIGLAAGAGVVSNCTIINNTAQAYGGGIRFYASGAQLYNCLIANNSATVNYGGGIRFSGATNNLFNCTVAGNTAPQGGGLYAADVTSMRMLNTIIYSNTAPSSSNYNFNTNYLTNCCSPGLSGQGNIAAYPKFVDMVNSNYRLQGGSPCINAGLNLDWMAGSKDLDGRERLDRLTRQVDIGTYEFMFSGTMFSVR